MKPRSATIQPQPLQMVCSASFGRYPKIAATSVYNMFQSDNWMVNYAGHKKSLTLSSFGTGRGIFNSTRLGKLIAVVSNGVFLIDRDLSSIRIGLIDTYNGDVFIDENDAHQIAICDKKDIYIFDYIDETFRKAIIDFIPGYVSFQNGYFISPDINTTTTPSWRLSAPNNGLSWPAGSSNVGRFQTKPDVPVACVRFPGRGNQLFVMGSTVTEIWVDVGSQLFPYQRSSTLNIDYGCLNASTIAAGDNFIVWLGVNEKSGAVIMHSSGGEATVISNDGINYKLAQLKNPSNSYGFLFKQDGHLFYQLTFADPQDDLTLIYDFNVQKFYFLCDERMHYHVAKRMANFHNTYYFVSFNDGGLYESNSAYTTFDGNEIPRIIIPPTIRSPSAAQFIVNSVEFVIEQGMENETSLFTDPLREIGDIAISSDFPTLNNVRKGDCYKVIANTVTDNNPIKTNTGQSFSLNNKIVWDGVDRYTIIQDLRPRVDLSVSRDGGYNYSNTIGMQMNQVGVRRNKMIAWSLGYCNEITFQFRFWGTSRFVVNNGFVSVYQ